MKNICRNQVGTTNYDGLISNIQALAFKHFREYKFLEFIFIKASAETDHIYRKIIR
jgi:hypothetical protein